MHPAASRLDLRSSARLMGHARWIELRLFELLGRWAVESPEPPMQVLFATHCHRHAWHAALWADTLPTLRDLDPESVTVAAGPAWTALVEQLTSLAATEQTLEAIVGVGRVVLPRLTAAIDALGDGLSPLTDGPAIRTVTLVRRDLWESWQAFEFAAQSAITSPTLADRAGHQVSTLERLLAEPEV